jgi:hypothetical protein
MKNNDLQKINNLLNKYLSQKEITLFLNKPQSEYFNLSINQFIKLNKKDNTKIVLQNLKDQIFGEAMGA